MRQEEVREEEVGKRRCEEIGCRAWKAVEASRKAVEASLKAVEASLEGGRSFSHLDPHREEDQRDRRAQPPEPPHVQQARGVLPEEVEACRK